MSDVSPTVWIITLVVIAGLLAFDFFFHVRKAHIPTLKEAAVWSAIYVGIALVFGAVVWALGGEPMGLDYFQGYILEKALSVDNLFVFLIIMGSFKVPREDQQKVLLFGIVFALITRSVFILLGKAALEAAQWVFYLFGIFLLWTAIHMMLPEKEESDEADNVMIRLVKKVVHTSDHYDGDKLFTVIDGKRVLTPMLLVMLAIGGTDILFAFDSIPAIYGVTQNVYLVFTATAFSLMGLRQLYFLIDGFLDRLVYLNAGLTAILGFIGVKLIVHALNTNDVPFINGGEPWTVIPEIEAYPSLFVILGLLTLTVVASLLTPAGKALSLASALHREASAYINRDIEQSPAERDAHYAKLRQLEEKLGRHKAKHVRRHLKDDHDEVVEQAHALRAAGK